MRILLCQAVSLAGLGVILIGAFAVAFRKMVGIPPSFAVPEVPAESEEEGEVDV